MAKLSAQNLSRRERQIMDIVYRRDRVTVAHVREELPDPPSYSAVRAMLRVLEEKGHVKHAQDGPRDGYIAPVPRERARDSALQRLLTTFFDDSAEKAVAALLDMSAADLSEEDLDRLSDLIERAREEGR